MGKSADDLIYFAQPSTAVSTWRTLWPVEEMRRRGYEVQVESLDAGYVPAEPPEGALTVVHLTPSLWAYEPWTRRLEAIFERAGQLIVTLDDDWTRIDELGG